MYTKKTVIKAVKIFKENELNKLDLKHIERTARSEGQMLYYYLKYLLINDYGMTKAQAEYSVNNLFAI